MVLIFLRNECWLFCPITSLHAREPTISEPGSFISVSNLYAYEITLFPSAIFLQMSMSQQFPSPIFPRFVVTVTFLVCVCVGGIGVCVCCRGRSKDHPAWVFYMCVMGNRIWIPCDFTWPDPWTSFVIRAWTRRPLMQLWEHSGITKNTDPIKDRVRVKNHQSHAGGFE